MKTFALIGAAGYVAPKHMDAIRQVGGDLVACVDPHESVGILDQFFPNCMYMNSCKQLYDYCCNMKRLDYVVVCSPNHLHSQHCEFGLMIAKNVICEKPVVLREADLDWLIKLEKASGGRILPILQMRYHPEISFLSHNVITDASSKAEVIYNAPRGQWYLNTWKNFADLSGGLSTNIGIHLFDILIQLFGDEYDIEYTEESDCEFIGKFKFGDTAVYVELSIDKDLPPRRLLSLAYQTVDLSTGFGFGHVECYDQILQGNGFTLESIRPVTRLCESLRTATYPVE